MSASDLDDMPESDTESEGGISNASTACFEELSDCNYALDLEHDKDTNDNDDGGQFWGKHI